LILASRSPQRRAILEQLGIEFEVVPADVEERGEGDPEGVVVENALRKARAVMRSVGGGPGTPPPAARPLLPREGDLVLGADTEVVLGDRVYGKPADAAAARAMIAELSGRDHQVWSGIALVSGERERSAAVCTTVRFRELPAAEIDWYVGTGEWEGRAGGYAIQLRGAALVEAIAGDYNNVVGLPVAALLELAPELLGA
jgi:septum formation protein